MDENKDTKPNPWKDMFTKNLDQRYQELPKQQKKIYDLIIIVVFSIILGSFILKQIGII